MRYFSVLKNLTALSLLVFIFSCASRKDIVYFQNSDGLLSQTASTYEIKIQPDDLLSIIVSAEDPEIAAPFNLATVSIVNPKTIDIVRAQETMQLYLVDSKGTIDFPVLGKLKVGGLSRSELLQMFQDKIAVYIKDPIVNIRIANFKIAVQGEVNAPGVYEVSSERITLIEALSLSKDLTIYGKRNNILIIREINGEKTFNRVDITKTDFINSPFYYLHQNDVVYVEPNKSRINGSAVGPSTSLIFSITSVLIAIITLIVRL